MQRALRGACGVLRSAFLQQKQHNRARAPVVRAARAAPAAASAPASLLPAAPPTLPGAKLAAAAASALLPAAPPALPGARPAAVAAPASASLRPVSPPVPVSAAVDSAPSASCCRLCCRRSPTQFCVPCLRDTSVSSERIA